jgi:hypothetical protein
MARKAHGAVIGFLKARVAHIVRIVHTHASHPARSAAMVPLKR